MMKLLQYLHCFITDWTNSYYLEMFCKRRHYFVALSSFESEDFFLPANSGQSRQPCILIQNSVIFNLLWVKVVADKYL